MRGLVIAPRWRKAWRDIVARPGRSALTVLAMAAGIFEVSALLYTYALLQPTLGTLYGRTRPSSATMVLDTLGDALVDSVRAVPGVAAVEERPVILARARVGQGEWVPALLYVIRDFDRQQMDIFAPGGGAWPPRNDEVLLERTALRVAGVAAGQSLTLRTAGHDDRVAKVSGTVYAAGLPPAWMEHMVPGFVTWNSPLRGGEGESEQLRIRVADHPLDEGYIREVVDRVQATLERQGRTVSRVTIPTPGRHPHADQMEAFLFLLLAFGVLSFALSALLIAGMIHALMAEQVREVGIMKALGARDTQVAGIYLGQVAMLAAAALALGIPTGLLLGRAYARFSAGILNADILNQPFPVWVVAAVILAGILVPLLFALGPVRRASGITIREALSDYPAPPMSRPARAGSLHALLARIPRPVALSLRTTFQRRGRLALTLGMLGAGGAVFVSALNVADDWTRSVDADFRHRRYDLTAGFSEPQPIAVIESVLAGVPEVVHAEYWAGASPYLMGPDGAAGSAVTLLGMEPGSRLLDLPVEGRWLHPGDSRSAVINQAVLARNPSLRIGDSVRVRLNGTDAALAIVGIARELNPMPMVYSTRAAVLEATGQSPNSTRSIRIVTRRQDEAGEIAAARSLEGAFEAAGLELNGLQRMSDARKGILDHLVIILSILTLASLVVVFVGGLGLTSTLSLNVIQRTREIGVLGAIGATPSTIARYIWFEGVLIGLMSWGVAMVLAIPISWGLESACGRIFFKVPLDFSLSAGAAAIWLGLVIVLATLSSFYPARRAARLTVREALAYV